MIKIHWDKMGYCRDGAGRRGCASHEHHGAPIRPLGMTRQRRLAPVLAGQAPYDLARSKGFEPLTF